MPWKQSPVMVHLHPSILLWSFSQLPQAKGRWDTVDGSPVHHRAHMQLPPTVHRQAVSGVSLPGAYSK